MEDELRPEYHVDYAKSKPNRFAERMKKGGLIVILEPEVAAVFTGSEAVNAALRSLMNPQPSDEHKELA